MNGVSRVQVRGGEGETKKQYAYMDGICWLEHVDCRRQMKTKYICFSGHPTMRQTLSIFHLHRYTSTGRRQHEMVLAFGETNVGLYRQCNGDVGNDISLAVHMQGRINPLQSIGARGPLPKNKLICPSARHGPAKGPPLHVFGTTAQNYGLPTIRPCFLMSTQASTQLIYVMHSGACNVPAH